MRGYSRTRFSKRRSFNPALPRPFAPRQRKKLARARLGCGRTSTYPATNEWLAPRKHRMKRRLSGEKRRQGCKALAQRSDELIIGQPNDRFGSSAALVLPFSRSIGAHFCPPSATASSAGRPLAMHRKRVLPRSGPIGIRTILREADRRASFSRATRFLKRPDCFGRRASVLELRL